MSFLLNLLLGSLVIHLALACSAETIKLNPNKLISCEAKFIWDSPCRNANFDSCRIKTCLEQYSYENGTRFCMNSQEMTEDRYKDCMKICCPSAIDFIKSPFQSVHACNYKKPEQDLPTTSLNNILVMVAAILGVIFLVFIAGIIYKKCILKKTHRIRAAIGPGNPEENREEKSQIELMANCIWTNNSIGEQNLAQCVICLEEKPNLQLECGHLFHPNCLRAWLQKKRQCGICRGQKLQRFKLKCDRCFGKQTRISRNTLMKSKQINKNMRCLDCSNK